MGMIYAQGVISSGKSSLTKILSDVLGTKAYYEEVDKMPALKAFYAEGEESRKDLSFFLQIAFLNYRYGQLQHAKEERNSILDSSLLSDALMAKNLYDRGEFPEIQYFEYRKLAKRMISNVNGKPFDGFPELIIFIDVPFELMLEHIEKRGREMEEIDDDKRAYYKSVWDIYQSWYKSYAEAPVLRIDMTKYDFVNSMSDRKIVLTQILERMVSLSMLSESEYEKIKVDKLEKLV